MNGLDRLAFVDLETTGMAASRERIIEIGLIEVDRNDVHQWSTLIRPEQHVPSFISELTGISSDMLVSAPRFADIAHALHARLAKCLFIAHHARFDYSFLRSEFRRVGIDFSPTVLCTVKLSRHLFPGFAHHNLDALIERHRLVVSERHRALGDASLIWQFWQQLHERFGADTLARAVKHLTALPSLPAHLDASLVDALPGTAGVYLFYGENSLPLYIGKANDLRRRVLSHFSADHRDVRELALAQQIRRIDWIETAGEIGALLKEAQLIKRLVPIYNRQLRQTDKSCAWRILARGDALRIELVEGEDLLFDQDGDLYGLFGSAARARSSLRQLAEQQQLCPVLLGLDKVRPGKPCFASQVGRCRGVCTGRESPQEHAARLFAALATWRLLNWPYDGPIAIREGSVLHLIDRWSYLGTAQADHEVFDLLDVARPPFDRDVYRILAGRLARLGKRVELLGKRP